MTGKLPLWEMLREAIKRERKAKSTHKYEGTESKSRKESKPIV